MHKGVGRGEVQPRGSERDLPASSNREVVSSLSGLLKECVPT